MEDVAILYICTGNYPKLFPQFYESARENLLPSLTKHYYVWTDCDLHDYYDYDESEVSVLPTPYEAWPAATLFRYRNFLRIRDILLEHKYVYFCNADLNFYREVGEEILPDESHPLVGVQHIQFDKPQLKMREMLDNTEKNVFSHAFINPDDMPYTYIFGCFYGGFSKEFVEMSETLSRWTDEDYANNIIPVWHDESFLNAYRLDNPELFKILPVQYAYPDLCYIDGYDDIKVFKVNKNAFFNCSDYREYTKNLENQFNKHLGRFLGIDVPESFSENL